MEAGANSEAAAAAETAAAAVGPEEDSGESEDEALLARAQKLISKIVASQGNPNPRLLHTLATTLRHAVSPEASAHYSLPVPPRTRRTAPEFAPAFRSHTAPHTGSEPSDRPPTISRGGPRSIERPRTSPANV